MQTKLGEYGGDEPDTETSDDAPTVVTDGGAEICDRCGEPEPLGARVDLSDLDYCPEFEGVCSDCLLEHGPDACDHVENDAGSAEVVTDGGEPAGIGHECILRGCGNEITEDRDGGYCSDRCKETNAKIQSAVEQNRRAERRRAGEADVMTDGGEVESDDASDDTAAFRVGGTRAEFTDTEEHRCGDCGEHEELPGDTSDVSGQDWHDYDRLCSGCITDHGPDAHKDVEADDESDGGVLDEDENRGVVDPYPGDDEEIDDTPL